MVQEEHFLAEPGDTDLHDSVDKTDGGDDDEEGPPDPEDEEVVLIEQIVGENTNNILVVNISTARNGSSANITGNLCRKYMTHWIGFTVRFILTEFYVVTSITPELSSK